ncbi:pre-mRNA-splicing factor rse1 [Metarhizium acridum]|nr:pre-mRNA-splicing factor rse1 [Metarhizium acridum]
MGPTLIQFFVTRLHYPRFRFGPDRHCRVRADEELILSYPSGNIWKIRCTPCYPRSISCRRPKGSCLSDCLYRKNKLVYVLNRNAEAELTISSPLEAHKHGILVFSVVSLDVGYANPVFAALEADYTEAEQDDSAEVEIQLVYYELDLGLNHVVRKWSEVVDPTSSLLFQVPGGSDGPSGVLVCGRENVTYRHSNQEAFRVPIPRRRGATEDPQRRRIIVSGVMHKLKGSTSAFFFLLQTDDGDFQGDT